MATGRGSDAQMGCNKEAVFGTAIAVDQKIPLISETLFQRFDHIENPALIGVSGRAAPIQGTKIVEGGFTALLSYESQDQVFDQFFGTLTQIDPTGNPTHYEYDLADTTENKGLTLAIEKQVNDVTTNGIHEFRGYKPSQLTVTGSPDQGCRYSVEGFAVSRDLNSSTNTTTEMNALTAPAANCLFHHCTFSINAIGSGLTVYPFNGFTLTINRSLRPDAVDATDRLQAIENDLRASTLQLSLARYTTNQFHVWHDNHTALWAKLAIVSGSLEKRFRFVKLYVTDPDGPSITGPGLMNQTITFSLHTDTEGDNSDAEYDFSTEVQLFEST